MKTTAEENIKSQRQQELSEAAAALARRRGVESPADPGADCPFGPPADLSGECPHDDDTPARPLTAAEIAEHVRWKAEAEILQRRIDIAATEANPYRGRDGAGYGMNTDGDA